MKVTELNINKRSGNDGFCNVTIEWSAQDVSQSELEAIVWMLYKGKIPELMNG